MSISSELLTLQNTKTAIRTAINSKGGSVEASAPFASYATAIQNLPSGGSGNPLLESIDVSDFTGTTFNLVTSYITGATIPSGVTSIGNNAFSTCSSLTSITIPNSVTSIGYSAFYQCSGLTSITIPNSVTSIQQNVFQYTGLTSVIIPNTLTSLGNAAFSNCSSLTSVTIGNGITNAGMGQLIFAFDNNLSSVILTDGLTSIGVSMFNSCTSLTSINIPSSVSNIGSMAFRGCTAMSSITVNATTPPTLGSSAFDNTNNCPIYVPASALDTYKAASGWSTYESRIFAIGDAITFTPTNGDPAISVKNYELASANYVQSTDVPATIKNGAGSLEICEGVTRIGRSAFQNGTSLTSVTLPSTLTRIDETVFDGCSSLTSVTVNATTPPTLYAAAFGGSYPIYVPASSVDAYKAASGWSTYESRIQAQAVTYRLATLTLSDNTEVEITSDTTTLTRALVSTPYNTTLVSASIAPDTTVIGDRTFYNCTLMTSVTFESGSACETIYTRAFYGCSGLTSITLPDTVTSIGEYAFLGTPLTSITIPDSVTEIGSNAFRATAFTSITIPDSVTEIGSSAFMACESLESATIGNGVETIGASVFSTCPSLENVTIGSGLTMIGTEVFLECESLTSVTMLGETPPELEEEGGDPFAIGGSGINTLYVPSASVSAYQTWVEEILGAHTITVEAIPAE